MSRLGKFVVAGALAAQMTSAMAADMPDDYYLRGSLPGEPISGRPSGWEGFYFGAHFGYSNLNTDFSGTPLTLTVPLTTTNSTSYGGFIGYNALWDPTLTLGLEFAYNRPSSLATSTSVTSGTTTATSSLELVDYATLRARAGYVVGQFLPYAVLGAAIGRLDYSVIETSAGATVLNNSRDNAYAIGFVGGLGMDVALLPNVFLRGEWEYIAFSPVGGIRSSLNTGRVGIGVLF
jgi:outer membrane immunogenic protein